MQTIGRLALAACAACFGFGAVQADEASESFIQDGAQRVLSVLADATMDDAVKLERLSETIDELFDVQYIAARALGRTLWCSDDQAARIDFVDAYRDYVTAEYENYLDAYIGQALQVTGSRDGERGSFVDATITSPESGEELATEWVVFKASNDLRCGRVTPVEEGSLRVVDVTVTVGGSEISLLTQQIENVRAIRESNSNRLPAIIEDMRARSSAALGG